MKTYTYQGEFVLESKKELKHLEIAYHTFGNLNAEKDNVIWVFHAISGDSDVMSWWTGLFGEGALYDPKSYFIICANCLGSPYGSTKPQDFDFPNFTIRDIVKAHMLLAEELEISKIHTAIGGSFGGYQALEFAYSFTGEINHLILLASSAKESAWGIAIHESQRMALRADVTFGETNSGIEGMKAARAIAMLTYRTSEDLIEKQTDSENRLDDFKASSYINYHGDKFSKRFDALSYYYLTKCIDSHNIGRGRGGEVMALTKINIPTLVIGFSSDTLVPMRFQSFLAENIPNAIFKGFESEYGHDGFLKEVDKISESIQQFYSNSGGVSFGRSKRVVLKFGGTSLYGKKQLDNVLQIVKKAQKDNAIALVVSARGKSTDHLIQLFDLAKQGFDFSKELEALHTYLNEDQFNQDAIEELSELKNVLEAIQLLRDDSEFAYDRVVAFGELISGRGIANWLIANKLNAKFIDARQLIFTEKLLDEFEINMDKSRTATQHIFSKIKENEIPVITGFIACSEKSKTVTLGRNGSNYTASLIANFIQAKEVQNWTDVKGIYSSNPRIVENAVKINAMTYKEANEMANFGLNLLHPKTILPLMQAKIPLVIKSTNSPEASGTYINQNGEDKGIKAVTIIENVCLITLEGHELLQKIGIDARIFSCLGTHKVSIKMISQASSERGIGFVIPSENAKDAELALNEEFKNELRLQQISSIRFNNDIGIVSIIGRHNFALEKAISTLRRNEIWMHLISNSISGEHISLVVNKTLLKKAARLVHNEVFGVIKTIHAFAFGKGQVGTALIDQILNTSSEIIKERRLAVKLIGIADSKKYFIETKGLTSDWKTKLEAAQTHESIDLIIEELKNLHLDNIIIVDNTSSQVVSNHYSKFVKSNFDIVASNKKFNSSKLESYLDLRNSLRQKSRHFYYEANVGAGLPIIDFLKSLYASSDVVTKIKGVFSGSLSYIFNNFSNEEISFSDILKKAKSEGYTEPDPREDLNGLDVARKLVILAREINYPAFLESVEVQNLIPESLRGLNDYKNFISNKELLDANYQSLKDQLQADEVLRYIAELDVKKGTLNVALKKVSRNSPLGQLKNADTLFEIYTESYKDQPIIIQGAGAGSVVTARAVYSDLLRVGNQK